MTVGVVIGKSIFRRSLAARLYDYPVAFGHNVVNGARNACLQLAENGMEQSANEIGLSAVNA